MHEFCPDEAGVCAKGLDHECPAVQPVPDGPKPGYCKTCGQYPQQPTTATGEGEWWVSVPIETIVHLTEYWNGNWNDTAMWDALNHIVKGLERLLPLTPKEPQ